MWRPGEPKCEGQVGKCRGRAGSEAEGRWIEIWMSDGNR